MSNKTIEWNVLVEVYEHDPSTEGDAELASIVHAKMKWERRTGYLQSRVLEIYVLLNGTVAYLGGMNSG